MSWSVHVTAGGVTQANVRTLLTMSFTNVTISSKTQGSVEDTQTENPNFQ
jgi:hypothetical protein